MRKEKLRDWWNEKKEKRDNQVEKWNDKMSGTKYWVFSFDHQSQRL